MSAPIDGLRYIGADPAARSGWATPEAHLAWFEGPGGRRWSVQRQHLSPFVDVRFNEWPALLRQRLVDVLCCSVTRAPQAGPTTLDLSRRFEVVPAQDGVAWRVAGFQHVSTADWKVVKHVLGQGSEGDGPGETTAWERILDRPIDTAGLLAALAAVGCTAWRSAGQDGRGGGLYRGLQPHQRLACMAALGPLREVYLREVQNSIAAAGNLRWARHVHFEEGRASGLDLLDDRGVWVTAKGPPQGLSINTAFSCLVAGESTLGPLTLRHRRMRIARDAATRRAMQVHTPLAWGF